MSRSEWKLDRFSFVIGALKGSAITFLFCALVERCQP